MRRLLFALVACVACRGDREPEPPRCPAGEVEVAGACAPTFEDCDDRSWSVPSGGCRTVGVPSDGCAPGLPSDGRGGCSATLPAARCPDGEVAWLGETTCHALTACPSEKWGGIPTPAVYVDAAFAGSSSDGTRERPFRTIAAALAVVPTDGVVAIAGGRYLEQVTLDRPARLFGECASKVEIEGPTDTAIATVVGKTRFELHRLAVRGPKRGVVATSRGSRLEAVWVHDVSDVGINVERFGEEPDVTLRDVLVERAAYFGVSVVAGKAKLQRVALRDLVERVGVGGIALDVETIDPSHPASAEATGLVVERVREAGINVVAASLSVDGALVRDVALRRDGLVGSGLLARNEGERRATVSLRGVLFERLHAAGISFEQADLALDKVVVRDVRPDRKKNGGVGVATRSATMVLSDSLIERVHTQGIMVRSSIARLRRTVVRDVSPQLSNGLGGHGLIAFVSGRVGDPLEVDVAESLFRSLTSAGVQTWGAKLVMDSVTVREVAADGAGKFGDGVGFASDVAVEDAGVTFAGSASLRSVLVRDVARAGLAVASGTLRLERSRLACAAIGIALNDVIEGASRSVLTDLGGNACGCAALEACIARTMSLDPSPR